MFIGGKAYGGVEIRGTGHIECGDIRLGDIDFTDNWTAGYTALDMFKQIYNRLDQVKGVLGISWDN